MLLKYLRRNRWYCLWYYSDKWGHHTAGNKKPRRSLSPTCLRSRTRVNFAGMPVIKTDMASVAGDFCSHIGTVSQAVPAGISQVARDIWEPGLTFRHSKATLRRTVTSFVARQVWFVAGNMRIIAAQLVSQQCRKTSCRFWLPVFPHLKSVSMREPGRGW